ncbi:hypothetical protein BCY86_06100 [Pajaroellobacter abortibovis]|uniref:MotA/TolQ/ExbB proton channel domain-containing protein n=2 Tax=Pajaroellobacter abortibovis TaxID=1882918 RepID=A0A1L6MXR9_9BACT|nr:hypothetical protein BCY86_06100 [Pajaroellobacter abortibovis]
MIGVCVSASLYRLLIVTKPTLLDLSLLFKKLKSWENDKKRRQKMIQAMVLHLSSSPFHWESDFLKLLLSKEENKHVLMDEQVASYYFLLHRWAHVPQICARLAMTIGFMLATLVMCRNLMAVPFISSFEGGEEMVMLDRFLSEAITLSMLGLSGAFFCIAVHYRAKRILKERIEEANRLFGYCTAEDFFTSLF